MICVDAFKVKITVVFLVDLIRPLLLFPFETAIPPNGGPKRLPERSLSVRLV
jgi:hypothetical protein